MINESSNYNRTMFSIIIPVYNAEYSIGRCLQSLLNQTYRYFEILIVDDGSTDNSYFKCREFAKTDKRIKLLKKENGGVSSARNYGLKNAKGRYVLFVDSDDYVERTLLEECYRYSSKDIDCIRFSHTKIEKNNKRVPYTYQETVFCNNTINEKLAFLENILFPYKIGYETCFAAFKREVIARNDIEFLEGVSFAEDLCFSCLFTLFSKNTAYINKQLYWYVISDSSFTRKNKNIIHYNSINELSIYVKQKTKEFLNDSEFTKLHYLFIDNLSYTIRGKNTLQACFNIIKSSKFVENKEHFKHYCYKNYLILKNNNLKTMNKKQRFKLFYYKYLGTFNSLFFLFNVIFRVIIFNKK